MYYKPITTSGITLLELLMTVCIIGVVLGFAVPSFTEFIRENRMATIANQLVSALAYARSEAIKRGVQVTMKHKDATPKVWETGWDIFTDINRNGVQDISDKLLITAEMLPYGYTLRTGANYANWVAYRETGSFRSSSGLINDTFRLCDSTKQITKSRAIIIKMGRVRIEANQVNQCP
jgi:type IV fimbrial biogenesis protein FimT